MERHRLNAAGLRLSVALCVLMLALGFIVGRASGGGIARARHFAAQQLAASPGVEATATREAELKELSALRTQVAELSDGPVCTPVTSDVPAASPTPLPPSQADTPVPYADEWTVTVTDISMMPTFERTTATGIYAKVSITATNNTAAQLRFPYDELILRDSTGRVFLPAPEVRIQNESFYFSYFPPSLPTDGFLVFDIATDAEGPFVLESSADPAFRVTIDVEIRG